MQPPPDISFLVGTVLDRYRLEQLIDYHPQGPLFLARSTTRETQYLLRILALDTTIAPANNNAYFAQVQQLVEQIAAFRHPYILPILEAGAYHGVPYLVYPHVAARTLSRRLDQHGALDLATTGRYLDEIAGALEYAHEHGVYHGALTTDSIFLQPDGRLLVADFGVRQMLALSMPDGERYYAQRDGVATPEQLKGTAVQSATDVYLLGAVLYRMLTGYPLFAGETPAAMTQQVLSGMLPSFQQWRPDVPPEYDSLLARALASTPARRIRRPGVLANAYFRLMGPQNSARVPFREDMPSARSAPLTQLRTETAQRVATPPSNGHEPPAQASSPPWQSRGRTRLIGGLAIVMLAIVLISGLLLAQQRPVAPTASGHVHFFDSTSGQTRHSNALTLTTANLGTPPAGSHYAAWLIDEQVERITPLGNLTNENGSWEVGFVQSDVNLLGDGDLIEVTVEQHQTQAPTGKRLLAGRLPPQAAIHVFHLMLSFPTTPAKVGLLVGLIEEVKLLDNQVHALQSANSANDAAGARCAVQAMLDIIEGTSGGHYQPLPPTCTSAHAGDTFGLVSADQTGYDTATGYLADAASHASLASQQPDATTAMRTHANHIVIALGNIKGWATMLDGDLVALLNQPSNASQISDIVTLADHAYTGLNGAQQSSTTDPTKAGAIYAYLEGQAMADISLTSP